MVADAVYNVSPISYCPFLTGVKLSIVLSVELVMFTSVNDRDAFK